MTTKRAQSQGKWKLWLLTLTPFRIVLLYAAVGCLWIAFSDAALTALVSDVNLITMISMVKGWLYVTVTAAMLFLLIRRGEASLRASEEKFRMLAETVAAAIFIYKDSTFLYVNSAGRRLTGYTEDELLRMNFQDVVHPDHRDLVRERGAARLWGESLPPRYEFKILTKGGEERWVDFTSGVIEFEGSLAGLGTAYDVTEHKKLEAQLRQSQKIEAVGLLAGGVAHDFNNILTAIIGYGNLVKMKLSEGDKLRSHVDQILASADRAAHLTHGLLAFSRKQILVPRPVDANEIIHNVGKLLARLIGEDVELKLSLCHSGVTVLADSGQIEQVLMNLATNARDAMPHGGVLAITTERSLMDEAFIAMHGYGKVGAYALITVSDTGAGMDQRTQDRIFEPFFTTKELGKGTGLGLSIVYGIIKQHDGFIAVYSEPGQGTSFKICLPLLTSAANERPRTAQPEAVKGGSETVLVAEDNDLVRDLTVSVLTEAGYSVITAADGEEAIRTFEANQDHVRLLLLDAIMPRKNGREVYEAICRIRPGVKTLFMSGYAADILEKELIPDQGVSFISKPVSPAALLKKIRETLDN